MNEFNKDQYRKDLNNVRNAFERAATSYDKYSILQRTISDRLSETLDQIKINPLKILDFH